MRTIKVLVLQSFFDVAVQYTGSAVNAYEIAKSNNRIVTEILKIEDLLIIPEGLPLFRKELQYYQDRNIIPATGMTDTDLELLNPSLGIGLMAIESTFIIR